MSELTTYELLREGVVVDRRYRVCESIGRGGMSCVWEVEDLHTMERLALKGARPDVSLSAERIDQLIAREASIMRGLDHPAIPQIRDVVWHGGRPYILMELVQGETLASVMARQGQPFDERCIIAWGAELCELLDYLHRSNVVYRDMKPENLMRRQDGSLVLVDYGISHRMGGAVEPELPRGTPGYSAPEQLDGTATPEPTADIYALGATLYSLASGEVPQLVRLSDGREYYDFDMVPIRDRNQLLSEGLESALARATQRDSSKRYATAMEMRDALVTYRERSAEYEANSVSGAGPSGSQAAVVVIVLIVAILGCFALSGLLKGFWDALPVVASPSGDALGWAVQHAYVVGPAALVLVLVGVAAGRRVARRLGSPEEEPRLIDVQGAAGIGSNDGVGANGVPTYPSYADASRYQRAFVAIGDDKTSGERVGDGTLAVVSADWFSVRLRKECPCSNEVIEWADERRAWGTVGTVIDDGSTG